MSTETNTNPTNNGQATSAAATSFSEKFVARVQKQFTAEIGSELAWTPLQRTLAQRLCIKVDASLKSLEAKRAGDPNKQKNLPITWENVDMLKLSLDAVHRVSLELDALIPNHIHVIPYFNSRTQKYELDLRIGYMGLDHVHRRFAIDPPLDIRYQLVHATDEFSYGEEAGVAYVKFNQTKPFDPGEVIGGFGYIAHENPRKNRVVIIEHREFEKAMKSSMGTDFWGTEKDPKYRKEMEFKTVVIRTCKKIPLDPTKIHAASLAAIQTASEAALDAVITDMDEVEAANANQGVVTLDTPALQQPAPPFQAPQSGQGQQEPVTVAAGGGQDPY